MRSLPVPLSPAMVIIRAPAVTTPVGSVVIPLSVSEPLDKDFLKNPKEEGPKVPIRIGTTSAANQPGGLEVLRGLES